MTQTASNQPPGLGSFAGSMVRFHAACCALLDAIAQAQARELPVTALRVSIERANQARREFEALETPAPFVGQVPPRVRTEPAIPALQELAP